MGKDKLTRGELIQYIEDYCAGHMFCIVGNVKCRLLDTYCGGITDFTDLPTQKLSQIYNYLQDGKGGN